MENELKLRPIGVIRSPYKEPKGTPIQPGFSKGVRGEVVLEEEYSQALDDLDGFERIWLIFWLHRARPWRLKVVPYRDTVERGLFSTRSPSRPNPIGLSAVRLVARHKNRLVVEELDIIDGTPLLDIKPYIPRADAFPGARAGWFERSQSTREVADERFYLPEAVRLSRQEVVLRLGLRGCIEGTARHVHRKIAEELLQAGQPDPAAEAALELLGEFLEKTDFRALRAADEDLAGQKEAWVRVFRNQSGVSWEKL